MNSADSSEPRRKFARIVWIVGIALFVIAFIVPAPAIHQNGWDAWAGGKTFYHGTKVILSPVSLVIFKAVPNWSARSAGILFIIAWLLNFSVFVFAPRLLLFRWIFILAPWLVLLADYLLGWNVVLKFWKFPPFYFWAICIGLIHLSFYLRPQNPSSVANCEVR